MKVKTILASTAMLAGGLLGAATPPASAATPTAFCNGFPVDHYVPLGGALFVDPDGNAGSVIMGTPDRDVIHGAGGDDFNFGGLATTRCEAATRMTSLREKAARTT